MSTTEAIDVQAHETAMVPAPSAGLVRLAASTGEIVAAQREYQEVCKALLDGNDIQTIGKKEFKKRSAWNKLAVAFGVSTTEVRTTHERDERGRIIRTECLVRATAPNGRASDGIGACDLYERCCDEETCTKWTHYKDGNPTGHTHCSTPCTTAHFSNPQHDIPATAFTRASNRAKADLFGMGEVSAEEVSGDSHYEPESQPGQTDRSEGKPMTGAITDPQKGAIVRICRAKHIDDPLSAATRITGRQDLTELGQLTKSEASKIIDALNAEVA